MGASLTWQSILKGLETFKKGYIWRIGTGEEVNIWNGRWIPASPNLKLMTPKGQTIMSKVGELIDPSTGTWDETLLEAIFYHVDDRRILHIPIHYQAFDDFVAWQPNRTGVLSVRTTYHLQWLHTFRAYATEMERLGGSTP